MLPKTAPIFVSFHPDDEATVLSALSPVRAAGWDNIVIAGKDGGALSVSQLIGQCEMALVFMSKAYARDDRFMLEEFAYASVVVRKPFISVWLDSLDDIRQAYHSAGHSRQLLSTLEMLTAKHAGTTTDGLVSALEQFMPSNPPYTPSTPQICEKPCEAYEGNEPYIFISYAHDDAKRVYPIIKELYESGWDFWYDEGIKTTERYLPVIADNLSRCSVVVLMLTNRCLERPFVMNYELEYARQLGIPIIPVLMEELNPPEYAKDVAAGLLKKALTPDSLLERMADEALPNKGAREAVPPAIRQNVVYDVVLPPEVPGFEIAVQNNEITLVKYRGEESHLIIPAKVCTPSGEMEFPVTAIGFCAFLFCVSIKSVIIPDSVTRIGFFAFISCTSLTKIIIPDSVTFIDNGAFQHCTSLTEITISQNITNIGKNTFMHCESLTCITIPDRVESIGDEAFQGCTSLFNVMIPESVLYVSDSAFNNTPLTIPGRDNRERSFEAESRNHAEKELQYRFEIPESEDTPFAMICCAEKDIETIHKLLTELYWEGFNFKFSKTSDHLLLEKSRCLLAFFSEHTTESEDTMDILKHAIDKDTARIIQVFLGKCTSWPGEIQEKLQDRQAIIQSLCSDLEFTGRIRNSLRQFECGLGHPRGFEVKIEKDSVEIAKFHPTGFPQVIIPKTFFDPPLPVKRVGMQAFYDCGMLTDISIPESVTDVEMAAFCACLSLSSIKIPELVTRIGIGAFYKCVSLVSLSIPQSVSDIEGRAFGDCASLCYINIPDNVTIIKEYTFSNCTSLVDVIIPANVTRICDHAFDNCISLENITLPSSVTRIEVNAFRNCKSLKEIFIPKSVKKIGWGSFSGCASLIDFVIPESINNIENLLFANCTSLKNIIIPESVVHIHETAFRGCENLTIHTPHGSAAWQYAEEFKVKHESISK